MAYKELSRESSIRLFQVIAAVAGEGVEPS